MNYLCLIYSDESAMASATPEQTKTVMDSYWAFNKELDDAEVALG